MDKILRVGAHEITIEEDICFLKADGTLSLQEVQFYHSLLEQCFHQHGRSFALINMAKSGLIDADARRWTANWHKHHRISGAALFGGSGLIGAIYHLTSNAVKLVTRQPLQIVYCRTESEARAWIADQRTT